MQLMTPVSMHTCSSCPVCSLKSPPRADTLCGHAALHEAVLRSLMEDEDRPSVQPPAAKYAVAQLKVYRYHKPAAAPGLQCCVCLCALLDDGACVYVCMYVLPVWHTLLDDGACVYVCMYCLCGTPCSTVSARRLARGVWPDLGLPVISNHLYRALRLLCSL